MPDDVKERLAAALRRHDAALHAMQSGVAFEMGRDPKATEPKHLRVGVNSALVYDAAVAKLLIEKGIITEVEYFEACADAMEAERRRYEVRNGIKFG